MGILDAFKNDKDLIKLFWERIAETVAIVADAYRYTIMANVCDDRDTCGEDGKKVMTIPVPDWLKKLDDDNPFAFAASEAAKCGFYLGLLDFYIAMGLSNENARALATKTLEGVKMTTANIKPDGSVICDDEVPGVTAKQAKAAAEELNRFREAFDAVEQDKLANISDAHNQAQAN